MEEHTRAFEFGTKSCGNADVLIYKLFPDFIFCEFCLIFTRRVSPENEGVF